MGPISITWLFFGVGCLAIYCMYLGMWWAVALLLPLKSIIDAADGEMARFLDKPSYVGRYLDSNLDLVLNVGLFGMLWYLSSHSGLLVFFSWLSWQLQGTFYNYYYVIRRSQFSGDTTSQSNESTCPTPYPYERAWMLRFLHRLYLLFYGWQDRFARVVDPGAPLVILPKWFMTLLSVFGLGFQLLLFGVLLFMFPSVYILFYVLIISNVFLVVLLILRFLYA
ncbi:MAG: CDP-alcohol phosphatidyltransferase family protein [bacterium]|nr:CDP-alcohol phosphatidyltransferase family protein [bacterium]